jgi:hypothetical protein
VPISFYENNTCEAIANNLDIQNQRWYLMAVDKYQHEDKAEYDSNNGLVFCRLVLENNSAFQFAPLRLNFNRKLDNLYQLL